MTGNTALDSLMSRYGFSVDRFDSVSFSGSLRDRAEISTYMAINTQAFGDSLASFPGVVYWYFGDHAGDHNYITYSRDSVSTFSFSLGWGDCPAGCTSRKIWKYKVDDLCNVTLLSVTQYVTDRFPTPANCNLHPIGWASIANKSEIKVYPNPMRNVLHIDVPGDPQDCNFTIFDLVGRTITEGICGNHTFVNTSNFPKGVYTLTVRNTTGSLYRCKIVKE